MFTNRTRFNVTGEFTKLYWQHLYVHFKSLQKTQGESAGRPKKLSGNAVGDVIRLQRSSEFQWWAHIMIIIIINMIID